MLLGYSEEEDIRLFLKSGYQISKTALPLVLSNTEEIISGVEKLKPRPFIITENHVKKILGDRKKPRIKIEILKEYKPQKKPIKIEDYVKNLLDTGGIIMGLGHAVYQTDDPRAHILAPMSKTMGERIGETKWYEMSKLLEQKGKEAFKQKKGREIYVNVDFYSASLYYYMGIPPDQFTPIFAIARISGWVAHVIEEQFGGAALKPVLYRPDSQYIGDYCGVEDCTFTPIEER